MKGGLKMTEAEKRLLEKRDKFFLKICGGINAKEVKENEDLRTKCTNSSK